MTQRETAKRKAGRRPEAKAVRQWAIRHAGGGYWSEGPDWTRRDMRLARFKGDVLVRVEIREIPRRSSR